MTLEERICKAYLDNLGGEGAELTALAERFGRSRHRIDQILRKHGVKRGAEQRAEEP